MARARHTSPRRRVVYEPVDAALAAAHVAQADAIALVIPLAIFCISDSTFGAALEHALSRHLIELEIVGIGASEHNWRDGAVDADAERVVRPVAGIHNVPICIRHTINCAAIVNRYAALAIIFSRIVHVAAEALVQIRRARRSAAQIVLGTI